jgi:hypothetical protein
MNWSEIFEYNDGKLFWKVSFSSRILVGSEAGFCSDQYLAVVIHRKRFFIHRIIWEMHIGPIPNKMFIKHIDGDRKNNRISNLRLVTRSQLLSDLHKPRYRIGRTSEFLGVSWCASNQRWTAQICSNGKRYSLGSFTSEFEANNAYIQAKLKLHDKIADLSLPHQLLAEEK